MILPYISTKYKQFFRLTNCASTYVPDAEVTSFHHETKKHIIGQFKVQVSISKQKSGIESPALVTLFEVDSIGVASLRNGALDSTQGLMPIMWPQMAAATAAAFAIAHLLGENRN